MLGIMESHFYGMWTEIMELRSIIRIKETTHFYEMECECPIIIIHIPSHLWHVNGIWMEYYRNR